MSKLFDRMNTLTPAELANCFGIAIPTLCGEKVLGFSQKLATRKDARMKLKADYEQNKRDRLAEKLARANKMADLMERYPTICEVCEVVGLIGSPKFDAMRNPKTGEQDGLGNGLKRLSAQMAKNKTKTKVDGMNEQQLDNILVSQKDDIIRDINGGLFNRAQVKLRFVANLWINANYEYKLNELLERLDKAVKAEFQNN